MQGLEGMTYWTNEPTTRLTIVLHEPRALSLVSDYRDPHSGPQARLKDPSLSLSLNKVPIERACGCGGGEAETGELGCIVSITRAATNGTVSPVVCEVRLGPRRRRKRWGSRCLQNQSHRRLFCYGRHR